MQEAKKEVFKGGWVAMEGIDGTGKTAIAQIFKEMKFPVDTVLTRFPGGTTFGEQNRSACLNADIDPQTQLLFYSSLNLDASLNYIKPMIAEGKLVISERSFGSTYAYQGLSVGQSDLVVSLLESLKGVPHPDLVIYLDIDMDVAEAREMAQNRDQDRYASFDRIEKEKIKEAYDLLYKRQRDTNHIKMTPQDYINRGKVKNILAKKVIVVDANQPLNKVVDDILGIIVDHVVFPK